MAELALLAGLGYAGYISEKDPKNINNKSSYDDKILLDDYRYSQYHSNIVQKTDENIKNIYDQRKKDTMDPKKFMIPVYYGLEDKAREMGTGTDIIKNNVQESFTNQFDLQKFNVKSAVASNDINGLNEKSRQNEIASKNRWSVFEDFNTSNDSDMTYGIVAKDDKSFVHNNMNIFNRMRDFETPQLRDNRKLEYFSGSSKTYTPKKEVEPFFKPVSDNTWGQGGMPSVTTFIEDRMEDGVKLEKRKQKPFEPRKIGPGIGLSVNQDSLGGIHDTVRILPPTIDQLRRKDDQKVSYTPPVLPGKKGERRPVVANFERRKHNRYRTSVEPVRSGGQIKNAKPSENINIEIGNRTFSTPVIGTASGNYGINTPEMRGEMKDPKDKQLIQFNQGPVQGNNKFLQDVRSYKISDTQRVQTNTQINGNIGSQMQGTNSFNPNNIANPTQQLQSYIPTGASSQMQGINTFNPNNIAIPTQQLQSYIPTGASNQIQGINTFNPNNIANPTQQLQSYNPVGASNQIQGINVFNPNNIANPTQQLQSYNPVGASNQSQGTILFNPNNIARQTQQQDVMAKQYNSFLTGQKGHTTQFEDSAKETLQQDIMAKQYNTFLIGQKGHTTQFEDSAKETQQQDIMATQYNTFLKGLTTQTTHFEDEARQTQQQDIMAKQYNSFLTGQKGHIAQLEDNAKQTNQQDIMAKQYNTFIAGQRGQTSQFEDTAKYTQQQEIMATPYNTFIGTHQDSGYMVTDARAPTTIKQLVNYNNHINAIGNKSTYYSNPYDATHWEAPITLKDMVKTQDYFGSAGNPYQTKNQMQYNNAHTNLIREVTVAGRAPTNSNVLMIPDINSIGLIELRDHINIDRYNPVRQTNFNAARPEINQMNKTNAYYEDHINQNQMDTLVTNPYYSNGINQIYHYTNNPVYAQSINHEKFVPMPLNQLTCLNQDHLR